DCIRHGRSPSKQELGSYGTLTLTLRENFARRARGSAVCCQKGNGPVRGRQAQIGCGKKCVQLLGEGQRYAALCSLGVKPPLFFTLPPSNHPVAVVAMFLRP